VFLQIRPKIRKFVLEMEHLRDTHSGQPKIITDAKDHTPTNNLTESFATALNDWRAELAKQLAGAHLEVAEYGRKNAIKDAKIKNPNISVTAGFVNPDIQHYFLAQSSKRVTNIDQTTMMELQNQLFTAYTLKEKPAQWQARIEQVLNCEKPRGRAQMIARTELAWAYRKGLFTTYEEIGTRQLERMEVMDSRTCQPCRDKNGEIYTVKEAEAEDFHPQCRGTFVGAD